GVDGVLRSHSVRSCSFIRLRGAAAAGDQTVALGGLTVQIPDDGAIVDAACLSSALAEPGPVWSAPLRLGAADVWDGFGLWLALHEPATCRLMTDREQDDAVGLLRVGVSRATVALASRGQDPPGLAAIVASGTDGPGPWTVAARAFGPAGPELAGRVLAALESWNGAGRPTAAELRIEVVPGRDTTPAEDGPVIVKEHCTVRAGW
ncbi:MAG TPA: hypothetical protein VD813_16255, partial [Pseudonocardia sp.]|nr:hypothetical protein [Pseudonocardia sp.]